MTGASGYLGNLLVADLATNERTLETIVASDIRVPDQRLNDVVYVEADIRDGGLQDTLAEFRVDVVVHLAAIVSPGRRPDRALEYAVDVGGTRNVLEACAAAGVKKLIVSSSGAAYGYHSDSPAWIDEGVPLRGNPTFAYADHKRIVEEMLEQWRSDHPDLGQLIFRPGTILGEHTHNQITDLFDRRFVLGISGADSPFVFIWDADVVACLRQGIESDATGIFNLAGDGAVPLRSIARMQNKRYIQIPGAAVGAALAIMKRFGITQYGPEQIDFLRYRPVLSNRALKEDFGYIPEMTSEEVFKFFIEARLGQT
ncbi:MAG: SDR family oxidoreductase [Actinomycetota bacterium]